MAICRYCGATFDWGSENGKWVKLVPIGADDLLLRTHQDENGRFRAKHLCAGGRGSVTVVKLERPILPEQIVEPYMEQPTTEAEQVHMRKKHRARRRKAQVQDDLPF